MRDGKDRAPDGHWTSNAVQGARHRETVSRKNVMKKSPKSAYNTGMSEEEDMFCTLDCADREHRGGNPGECGRDDDFCPLTELASGIAHEINNPVNGIINYAQILVNRLSMRRDEAAVAERIISEGERIAGIVKSLMNFTGKGDRPKSRVSLEELLSVCLDLTRARLKEDGIRLEVNIEEGLPRMIVDVPRIRLLILILISNARHELNEKYPAPHYKKLLRISGKRGENHLGECVRMEFHNRGAGVSVESLGRDLTLFFSAWSGLSVSSKMILRRHGAVHIDSVPGECTGMVVELSVEQGKRGEIHDT